MKVSGEPIWKYCSLIGQLSNVDWFLLTNMTKKRYSKTFLVVIFRTRIFGAFGPIMFALWVWVGFGASFAKLRQPTGQTFFPTFPNHFPISFKPKVAIAEFFWKMQRKTWYSILGLDAMPLSLKNLLLSRNLNIRYIILICPWLRSTLTLILLFYLFGKSKFISH